MLPKNDWLIPSKIALATLLHQSNENLYYGASGGKVELINRQIDWDK